MGTFSATTVIPFFTNLPRDVITNTLWFEADEPSVAQDVADEIASRVTAFYEDIYVDTPSLKAPYVNWAQSSIFVYDNGAPTPRVPFVYPLDLSAGTEGSGSLPTEVACVLSFEAARVNGIPQARRQGRIFLGGLGGASITAGDVSNFPRFNTTMINAAATAALNLLALNDSDVWWVVHSKLAGNSTVAQGWVDNGPDTQRRRSVDATVRTPWHP